MGSKTSKAVTIAGTSKSAKSTQGKNIAKDRTKITKEDEAILNLKRQRDIIKQYQRQILLNSDREKVAAKKALVDGNRDKAMMLLKKKRFRENLIHQSHKQLENIEEVCQSLEFAHIESKVLDSLTLGNEALKKVYKEMMSIEQIEKMLGETHEEIERQQAINRLLSGHLSGQDIQEVELELANLLLEDKNPVEKDDSGTAGTAENVQALNEKQPQNVHAVQESESENAQGMPQESESKDSQAVEEKVSTPVVSDTQAPVSSSSNLNQVRVSKLEFPEVPETPMPGVSSEALNKDELVLPDVPDANPSTSSTKQNADFDTDNYLVTSEHKHKHKHNQKFSESAS